MSRRADYFQAGRALTARLPANRGDVARSPATSPALSTGGDRLGCAGEAALTLSNSAVSVPLAVRRRVVRQAPLAVRPWPQTRHHRPEVLSGTPPGDALRSGAAFAEHHLAAARRVLGALPRYSPYRTSSHKWTFRASSQPHLYRLAGSLALSTKRRRSAIRPRQSSVAAATGANGDPLRVP
jgi:hypothetical protein